MKQLLILCFLLPLMASAQLLDSFDDGDFSSNPAWVGDVGEFIVNGGQELQSMGPAASSVLSLSTTNDSIDNTEWRFKIRLGFAPSSSNYVRVYLVSDQADLKAPLNGYFIQFGESSSSADTLDFFRQDGTTLTKLFSSFRGCASSNPTEIEVKVIRDAAGNWEFFSDCSGGSILTPDGSVSDATHASTAHFGVYCRYGTVSRSDKYFFDDFYIGAIEADTTLPELLELKVVSATQLKLTFSEPMAIGQAQVVTNYSIDNGIGQPVSADRDAAAFNVVNLDLANALILEQFYMITISNLEDIGGNQMLNEQRQFAFYNAAQFDIVINELMADPEPAVGLPVCEYLELYNRSGFPINIENWQLSDRSTSTDIPAYTIEAGEYVILCPLDSLFLFSAHSNLLGLPSWPSLNNGDDDILLKDDLGNRIFAVSYTDDWYADGLKDDGGYSLEMIDPNNPCGGEFNWRASDDVLGGTPGTQNSVFGNNPDTIAPNIVGISVSGLQQILVCFSEPIDSLQGINTANYAIDFGIGSPVSVTYPDASLEKALLNLIFPIDSGQIYNLTVNGIGDCAGNLTVDVSAPFAIPDRPNRFDVLINEIMADPEPSQGLPEVEYVELYNRSDRTFNLADWKFADRSSEVDLPAYLLLPTEYVVLVNSTAQFDLDGLNNVVRVPSFPSLNVAGDDLKISDANGRIIDLVLYEDDWYRDDSKSDGGYSLERIDYENPCVGSENWASSQDSIGGTPGIVNSIQASNPDTLNPRLLRAAYVDSITMCLFFSESMDSSSAAEISNYSVDGLISPIAVEVVPFEFVKVILTFDQPFIDGQIYEIEANNVFDCSGNSVLLFNTVRWAIPQPIASGDLVINEVLFNAFSGGTDFVEIYNLSDKVIDLQSLRIAEESVTDPGTFSEEAVIDFSLLAFPGDHVVFTEDDDGVDHFYAVEHPGLLFELDDMPSFSDAEGIVQLFGTSVGSIDRFHYYDDWHFALLDDEDGISLERISYTAATQLQSNWHSAATTVGGATPTKVNSQFAESGFASGDISIIPELFTPDQDGNNDFTQIYYQFDQPGYVANAFVYDAKGRQINHLVKSELLSSEGFWQWNGETDENEKARVGIYIVLVEVIDLKGDVQTFKEQVVLGAKF